MATISLEELLKKDTIDLSTVHEINVGVDYLTVIYNPWKDVNSFVVDAANKGIKFVFAGSDGKATTKDDLGHEHYVAVKNADSSVSILFGLSSDYIEALSNPHTFKVDESIDEGKALFAGFKAFLDTNYDGLFSGSAITVEIDDDVAPSTTTTTTAAPTTTSTTTVNP